jgi:hypothetical protein
MASSVEVSVFSANFFSVATTGDIIFELKSWVRAASKRKIPGTGKGNPGILNVSGLVRSRYRKDEDILKSEESLFME